MTGAEPEDKMPTIWSTFGDVAGVTPRDKWDYSLAKQDRVWETIGFLTLRETRARFGLSLTINKPK